MGARQKLNNVYLTGALLVAGIAGLLTKSWMIFLIVAGWKRSGKWIGQTRQGAPQIGDGAIIAHEECWCSFP